MWPEAQMDLPLWLNLLILFYYEVQDMISGWEWLTFIKMKKKVPALLLHMKSNWFSNKLRQECIPVGYVPPACCLYLPACTVPGGCLPLVLGGDCLWSQGGGGACLWSWGGCLWSQGGSLPLVPGGCLPLVLGGVHPSMHWGRHPPVDRMTDTCKYNLCKLRKNKWKK